MHRKFIATIAATAIAITAIGSTPAFADEYDNGRLLAAILGLAVVGKIIHDKNKDKRRSNYDYRHEPQVIHKEPTRDHRIKPRPLPPRVAREYEYRERPQSHRRADRRLLPGKCFRSFDTWDGRVRMFGRKCLKNNYRFADRLPRHCLTAVRTDRGKRRGYEARCLRREGYRLAHR